MNRVIDPFCTYPTLANCFHQYMEHQFPNATPIFKAEIKKAYLVGISVALALLTEGGTGDPNSDALVIASNLKKIAQESLNSIQETFPNDH